MINMTNAAADAQTTGDTSQMMTEVYNIVFPLLPTNGAIYGAYQDFSNFIDGCL